MRENEVLKRSEIFSMHIHTDIVREFLLLDVSRWKRRCSYQLRTPTCSVFSKRVYERMAYDLRGMKRMTVEHDVVIIPESRSCKWARFDSLLSCPGARVHLITNKNTKLQLTSFSRPRHLALLLLSLWSTLFLPKQVGGYRGRPEDWPPKMDHHLQEIRFHKVSTRRTTASRTISFSRNSTLRKIITSL